MPLEFKTKDGARLVRVGGPAGTEFVRASVVQWGDGSRVVKLHANTNTMPAAHVCTYVHLINGEGRPESFINCYQVTSSYPDVAFWAGQCLIVAAEIGRQIHSGRFNFESYQVPALEGGAR